MEDRYGSMYTFDNFVIDPEANKGACYAAMEVSVNPGQPQYNPLYIHSESGMGKTHLEKAIYIGLHENHPNLNVVYETAEEMVNNIIEAIKKNKIQDCRKKYIDCDVLLLDDIQLLSNKESLQKEIFYILNRLIFNKKQVILTGDRIPCEMEGIGENLLVLLNESAIFEIRKSCQESLTQMLDFQPCAQESWDENMREVIAYIAKNINKNNGEAIGALKRVCSFCDLMSVHVGLDVAKDILEGSSKQHRSKYEPIEDDHEDLFLITASEMERMVNAQKTDYSVLRQLQNEIHGCVIKEDIEKEFCMLYTKVSEVYDAGRKKLPNIGEELAKAAVYLLRISENYGADLELEIIKEIKRNSKSINEESSSQEIEKEQLKSRIYDLNARKEELQEYINRGAEWESRAVSVAEDTISKEDLQITRPEDMHSATLIDKAIELAKNKLDNLDGKMETDYDN